MCNNTIMQVNMMAQMNLQHAFSIMATIITNKLFYIKLKPSTPENHA